MPRLSALLAVLAAALPAAAQTTWTWNTAAGTWNTAANWSPAGPPASLDTTQLVFTNAGAGYTSTHNLGAFTLNRLTVNNTGTGPITIAPATLANDTLLFAGTSPTLDVQAGTALLTARMTGTATVTKTGAGTVLHDSNNAQFTGQLVIDAGTFVNRDSGNISTNFNPTAIIVNSGGTYQFGENTVGNPNLPDTTFITVNAGGTVLWQEGENLGGLDLRGGTFNLQQGGFNAEGGTPYTWTAGTFTGAGSNAYNVNGAPLLKTTAGTVTVTGNARFGGSQPITVAAGTLAFASAVNLTGSNPITLGEAGGSGTLEYQGATDATRAGTVTVEAGGGMIAVTNATSSLSLTAAPVLNGPLTKVGPGTLVLAAAPTGTGTTVITAGTVRVAPGTSAIGVQVQAGGTLAVSAGAGGTTFSVPTLAVAGTVQLELNAGAVPTAPLLTVANANGLTGGGAIRLINQQAFAIGTYPLIDYAGTAITSGFTLALPGRTAGGLVYNAADTRLDAAITGTDSIRWGGQASNVWDRGTAPGTGGTFNFRLVSNGAGTNFVDTDSVLFNDTGLNPALDLTVPVAPAVVTVNNASVQYTFGGAGRITGSGSFVKQGTGAVVLATDNDYTGGTQVTGGLLQLGTGGTTGSVAGPIALADNTTLAFNRSAAVTVANAITAAGNFGLRQNGTGAVTLSSALAAGANTVTADGPGDLTLAGVLSGTGTLTKTGAGTLTLLANNNPFTGAVNVTAGTLALDDRGGSGGDLGAITITVGNGATFQFGNTDQLGNPDLPGTTRLVLQAGGQAVWNIGEDYGRLDLQGGTLRINATATNSGNNNLTDVNNGPNQWASGSVTNVGVTTVATGVGGAGAVAKTTAGVVSFNAVNLNVAGLIDLQEGVIETNANIGGTGTAGALSFGTATTAGTLRLTNADTAVTQTVARPLAFPGNGTLEVTTAGKTYALTGGATGPGTLTKSGPGILAVSGTVAGPVVVAAGALRPGTATAAPTLGVPTLTLSAGSALRVNLFGTGAADNSRVNVTGTATVAAGTQLQLDLSALTAADVDALRAGGPRSYTVLTAGTLAGSFGGIDAANSNFGQFAGSEFALGSQAGNQVLLTFTPIPEPLAGLAVAAAGLAWVRRRRA